MKALKAFKKSFEALQISVKIKIYINFYFNTTFWNAWGGKVNPSRYFLMPQLNLFAIFFEILLFPTIGFAISIY